MPQSTNRRPSHRKSLSRSQRMFRLRRWLRAEPLERRLMLATVTAVDPVENSFNAPVSTNITATLDETVNAATATSDNFVIRSTMRPGLTTTVSAAGETATADPSVNFFPGELVHATVTAGLQGATPAVPHAFQFRTEVTSGSGQLVDSGQAIGNAADNAASASLGDLDGDGDLDVFLTKNNQNNEIWFNDGNAVFTESPQNLGGGASLDASLGDIDGDGDLDAVVANNNQANVVWTNDGSGNFTQAQTLTSNSSQAIELADLDADGDLDIFVGNRGPANRVFLNDGNGGFNDSGQMLGNSQSSEIELGDIDGDGDIDAVIGNYYQQNRIWLNDGNAVFTDTGQAIAFNRSSGMGLGDMDGDGDLDYVEANISGGFGSRVFNNEGNGVFVDSGQVLGGNRNSFSIAIGDMDGDGDLDYVVGNNITNRLYLNDGSGIFTPDMFFDPGSSRRTPLGDLDGDGDLDVFNANTNYGNPPGSRVFINQNTEPSVSLTADNASIPEAAGASTVTATLSAVHTVAVTVDLAFSGTANDPEDYTASGAQIVIAAGSTTGAVTVNAVQDSIDEPNETVVVDIEAVTNAQEAGAQQITITIEDDDEPIPVPDVTLTVDNTDIAENGGMATFTVTLSEVTSVPVTVDFGVSGTASATDFNASGTQVVIAAAATTGSITVTAVDDPDDEPDETVTVEITNVTGGTEVGDQEQTTTITDDDEPVAPDVTLSVDNTDIAEDGGSATFTVTLSQATTVAVTVELGITGTAEAGDFTVSATEVVIAPGATTGSVTVTAVQDEIDEPDETVILEVTTVTGGNEDGEQQQTTTILDDDIPPTFAVTSLTASASSFHVEFASSLDSSEINLFDTQSAGRGPADVVVTGAASGAVAGSLVIGESSVTFIKSGDPFGPDDYTVTLRSSETGFKDAGGALLDGDADGTGGDDYVSSFTIDEGAAQNRVLHLPDFVRGPGQDVNLPANETTGIPISISDGDNVRAIDLRISYDPALLEITDATAPAGGTVILNTNTPGLAILVFFNSAPLGAGEATFIHLEASVPADNASAIYQSQQILDVHGVIVGDGNDNEFPVVVDDAVHLATFFSDVSGNGRTNAGDASQVARFAALIDGGFGGSLNTDPIIAGDISGNGRINAADASLAARFAALIPVDQIPDIPAGVLITGTPVLRPQEGDAEANVPQGPGAIVAGPALTVANDEVGTSRPDAFDVVPDFWYQNPDLQSSKGVFGLALEELAEADDGFGESGLESVLNEILGDLLAG